ncbi:MAG: hypothetical protein ACPG8W_08365 [Candidatus Promineifilaceae bacterium]
MSNKNSILPETNTLAKPIETLEDMIARDKVFTASKNDIMARIVDIEFHENGGFVIEEPNNPFGAMLVEKMTDRALQQVCGRLSETASGGRKVPYSYIKQCPPYLQSANLEHWRGDVIAELAKRENRRRSKNWFVRLYEGNARAVLSERYAPIPNGDVLEVAQETMRSSSLEYTLIRPFVSADAIHIKVRAADTREDHEGGNYGIGFYVSNDEIGGGSLVCTPFLQRHSCTNSIIMQKSDFALKMRHAYYSKGEMRLALKGAMARSLKLSVAMIDDLAAAEEKHIPDFGDIVTRLAKKHGLKTEIKDNVLVGSEGMTNQAGIIHGLSYAAHATPDISQDARIDLEKMAGAVLATPDAFFRRAANGVVSVR